MELTKDDLYEIEKALDIYAGMLNDTMNRYCQTSINYEATNKGIDRESPLKQTILGLRDASERILEIREKLQEMRCK